MEQQKPRALMWGATPPRDGKPSTSGGGSRKVRESTASTPPDENQKRTRRKRSKMKRSKTNSKSKIKAKVRKHWRPGTDYDPGDFVFMDTDDSDEPVKFICIKDIENARVSPVKDFVHWYRVNELSAKEKDMAAHEYTAALGSKEEHEMFEHDKIQEAQAKIDARTREKTKKRSKSKNISEPDAEQRKRQKARERAEQEQREQIEMEKAKAAERQKRRPKPRAKPHYLQETAASKREREAASEHNHNPLTRGRGQPKRNKKPSRGDEEGHAPQRGRLAKGQQRNDRKPAKAGKPGRPTLQERSTGRAQGRGKRGTKAPSRDASGKRPSGKSQESKQAPKRPAKKKDEPLATVFTEKTLGDLGKEGTRIVIVLGKGDIGISFDDHFEKGTAHVHHVIRINKRLGLKLLKMGDVILKVNSKTVTGKTMNELGYILENREIPTKLVLRHASENDKLAAEKKKKKHDDVARERLVRERKAMEKRLAMSTQKQKQVERQKENVRNCCFAMLDTSVDAEPLDAYDVQRVIKRLKKYDKSAELPLKNEIKKVIRFIDRDCDGTISGVEIFNFLMHYKDVGPDEKIKLLNKSPFHARLYKMFDVMMRYMKNPPKRSAVARLQREEEEAEERNRTNRENLEKFAKSSQTQRERLLTMKRQKERQLDQLQTFFKRYDINNDGSIGVLEMRGIIYEMKQLNPTKVMPTSKTDLEGLIRIMNRNTGRGGEGRVGEEDLYRWIANEIARPAELRKAMKKSSEFNKRVMHLAETIMEWLRAPQKNSAPARLSMEELKRIHREENKPITQRQGMVILRMKERQEEAEKRRKDAYNKKHRSLRDKRREIAEQEAAAKLAVEKRLEKAKMRQQKRAAANARKAIELKNKRNSELEKTIADAEEKEGQEWKTRTRQPRYKDRRKLRRANMKKRSVGQKEAKGEETSPSSGRKYNVLSPTLVRDRNVAIPLPPPSAGPDMQLQRFELPNQNTAGQDWSWDFYGALAQSLLPAPSERTAVSGPAPPPPPPPPLLPPPNTMPPQSTLPPGIAARRNAELEKYQNTADRNWENNFYGMLADTCSEKDKWDRELQDEYVGSDTETSPSEDIQVRMTPMSRHEDFVRDDYRGDFIKAEKEFLPSDSNFSRASTSKEQPDNKDAQGAPPLENRRVQKGHSDAKHTKSIEPKAAEASNDSEEDEGDYFRNMFLNPMKKYYNPRQDLEMSSKEQAMLPVEEQRRSPSPHPKTESMYQEGKKVVRPKSAEINKIREDSPTTASISQQVPHQRAPTHETIPTVLKPEPAAATNPGDIGSATETHQKEEGAGPPVLDGYVLFHEGVPVMVWESKE